MIKNRWGKRVTSLLLGVLIVGVGILFAPRLHAALFTYTYPPDKHILVNRSFEPDDFSAVSSGNAFTVTIGVTNNEGIALRGFYYSDQVPEGWVVNTAGVSVNGSPIADYTYGQGYASEVYPGCTPHRWALELPQGDGVFSPTHPISASGGTAQIVYTLIVSGGTGSDYSIGYEAWAGWLETITGTAVFGYETVTAPPLQADFTARPRFGLPPLTVRFRDLSVGNVLTYTWDFGDGEGTALLPGPTHTYSAFGYYTVSLTIQDAHTSNIMVRPRYIHVTDVVYNVYLPVILKDYVP
jgi:PKD repeat protein